MERWESLSGYFFYTRSGTNVGGHYLPGTLEKQKFSTIKNAQKGAAHILDAWLSSIGITKIVAKEYSKKEIEIGQGCRSKEEILQNVVAKNTGRLIAAIFLIEEVVKDSVDFFGSNIYREVIDDQLDKLRESNNKEVDIGTRNDPFEGIEKEIKEIAED
jgi:hypothetical protein